MKIDFKDKKLKKLCEEEDWAQKKLGKAMATKLRRRMADLEAAPAATHLAAGRPHALVGDRYGQFALDLVANNLLIFEADHDPIPKTLDGGIDWSNVTQIRILEIGVSYHG